MVSFIFLIFIDIFIATLNHTHCVCQKGYYLAIISTVVETDKPLDELKPAFDLIGKRLDDFVTITDEFEPVSTNFDDGVVITRSFTSVSHFEPDTKDVLALYKALTGKELNLEEEEEDKQLNK
jgi:Rab GDP dissociation inhibitor